MRSSRVLAAATVAFALAAPAADAVDPGYEAANYNKINERANADYTPEFNALLAQCGLENQAAAASIKATDGPGRQYGRDFSAPTR